MELNGMINAISGFRAMLSTQYRLIRVMNVKCEVAAIWGILIISLLVPVMSFSQIPGVLTTEELNVQRLFIEANQEKLLGSYEEAATLYKEVLEHDPRNDAAAYELSRVFESLEKYSDAMDQINKAIRLNSDNIWYHLMKADVLESMENYPGAISVFEHLVSVNPKENYYFLHLVELLLKTNQLEKTLIVLDEFEMNAGILPEIIEYKVDVLGELNRPADAATELEKLVALYPRNTEYLHLLAAVYLQSGQNDKADACYAQILKIDPDDPRANLVAAGQFKTEGEDASYLRSIKMIMENPAIDLDSKITELIPYVEQYADDPNLEYAEPLGNLIANLVLQYDDEAKTHALYGDFLYHSGKFADAESEYKRTLILNKNVLQVWEQLMYIQAQSKNMDGLLRTTNDALEVFPNQGSIYYMSGLAYAYKEDYNQAVSELQQALIMAGRDEKLKFDVTSLLGKVYLKMGDTARANEAFDKALQLEPDNTELLLTYSKYLAQQGKNLNKADAYARKVLSVYPSNPEIEHLLALISLRKGDIKTSRAYIEQAMDHGAGDSYNSLELYGDILFSSGEIDKAVEYWLLSLNTGNNSEILKRKIAERKIVP